ncbi:MAG: hypothetical protein P4L22_00630 [Candidatus Babeliales bacterium]|nr:hypothetical protein [Candidatus Babeliales bacterium]
MKLKKLILLTLIIFNIKAADESKMPEINNLINNFVIIDVPQQYKIQEAEQLDINDPETLTAFSFKELIQDKTSPEEGQPMPYTLARVISIGAEVENPRTYIKYYDAETFNQFLFPGKEKFPTEEKLRQHLIRKKDLQTRLPIQDVQYFIINNLEEPAFKYHGNVSEYAIGIPQPAPEAAQAAAAPAIENEFEENINNLEMFENHRFILNYINNHEYDLFGFIINDIRNDNINIFIIDKNNYLYKKLTSLNDLNYSQFSILLNNKLFIDSLKKNFKSDYNKNLNEIADNKNKIAYDKKKIASMIELARELPPENLAEFKQELRENLYNLSQTLSFDEYQELVNFVTE